ncbi:unnamed protein product, partial [Candidula unifasciata]
LKLTFGMNTVRILRICPYLTKNLVNNRTLDMHCNLTEIIDELYLDGKSAGYICSVYVSG